MAKYAYPAVFTKEEEGYAVEFPDIDGCFTCAATLPEAVEMAEDALCLMLYDHEEDGEVIPPPSDLKTLQSRTEALVSLVSCDTMEYRRLYDNRDVKKNDCDSQLAEYHGGTRRREFFRRSAKRA